MGIFSDYLGQAPDFDQLAKLRKEQIERISALRGGRSVLVIAADIDQNTAPTTIAFTDIHPINDQLTHLNSSALDIILETPGGSGEVVEDIVKLLRGKFDHIGVIVPGWAKSAGTIMAMAADEILMEPASALGPIDAQIVRQGKAFSAEALIEGMERIKEEVANTGRLNQAYIPMLQAISPGELQAAQNSLRFAVTLVQEWLRKYKFRDWKSHSSTNVAVTDEEKTARAEEIAKKLCNHSHWLTHGRSIKIQDLEAMRLHITDYSKNAPLAEAIRRYYALLRMTFSSNVCKIIETTHSQIYRFVVPTGAPTPQAANAQIAIVELRCKKCKTASRVQANIERASPIQPGNVPLPADNRFKCPSCGTEVDLTAQRMQVEAQSGKRVVT